MAAGRYGTGIELRENWAALAELLEQASARAISPVTAELDVHREMLGRILQLLTEPKRTEGTSLHELLVRLVAAVEGQNRNIRELAGAVSKVGADLPLNVVRALDDNLDITRQGPGGPNGSAHG